MKPLFLLYSLLLIFSTTLHADFEAMKKRAQMAAQKNSSTVAHPESNDKLKSRAFLSAKEGTAQGNPNAQFSLGSMYYQGMVVQQDYLMAIEWFTKAAAQGHTKARYNLGHMYYEGRGIEINYEEAYRWFDLAAQEGDTKAQLYVAKMSYEGQGQEKDYKKAIEWYKSLTKKGYPEAQYMLGHMYHLGLGAPANVKMAEYYLNKSSKQSYGEAQLELANLYLDMEPPRQEEAKKLLQAAYLNGVREAKALLEIHQWELSP